MWLLGFELRTSGRAISALNLWAISPVPFLSFDEACRPGQPQTHKRWACLHLPSTRIKGCIPLPGQADVLLRLRREDWSGALCRNQQLTFLSFTPSAWCISIQLNTWLWGGRGRPAQWYICLSPRCHLLSSCLFQRRVVLLTQEMDAGIQAWKLRQQKLQEERKKEHDLKPKGTLLRSPLPNQ